MELHSHSRLKRIITPLGQFRTSAFDTSGDCYCVTTSMYFFVSLDFILSTTIKTGYFRETFNLTPDQAKSCTIGEKNWGCLQPGVEDEELLPFSIYSIKH